MNCFYWSYQQMRMVVREQIGNKPLLQKDCLGRPFRLTWPPRANFEVQRALLEAAQGKIFLIVEIELFL